MSNDVVHFPIDGVEHFPGIFDLFFGGKFFRPPTVPLDTPFSVNACSAAHGEQGSAVEIEHFVSHQAPNTGVLGKSLHASPMPFLNWLILPPTKAFVVAIDEERGPGAAFYPIDQIVFRDAEFSRNAKVSRNNKVVVMGEVFAFFPFDDIVHGATAVDVSGNVNHVRSFLVSEFDSCKLSCRLFASGCINPVRPLCAPVALDAAEPIKDFLKAYG